MSEKSSNNSLQRNTAKTKSKKVSKAATKKSETFCELCNISASNARNFLQHLNGRKHKSKISATKKSSKKQTPYIEFVRKVVDQPAVEGTPNTAEAQSQTKKFYKKQIQSIAIQNDQPAVEEIPNIVEAQSQSDEVAEISEALPKMPFYPDSLYSDSPHYNSLREYSPRSQQQFRRSYSNHYDKNYHDFAYYSQYDSFNQPERYWSWNCDYSHYPYRNNDHINNYRYPSYRENPRPSKNYSHSGNRSRFNLVDVIEQQEKCSNDNVNSDHKVIPSNAEKDSNSECAASTSNCGQPSEKLPSVGSDSNVQAPSDTDSATKRIVTSEIKRVLSSGPFDSHKGKAALLDNVSGRIARLINPCNHKDKAQLSHLMTEFSKSKKKLNLSRLMQSECIELRGNNDTGESRQPCEVEMFNTVQEGLFKRHMTVGNSNSEDDFNVCDINSKASEITLEPSSKLSIKGSKSKPLKENCQISIKISAKKKSTDSFKSRKRKVQSNSKPDKSGSTNSQENNSQISSKKAKRKGSNTGDSNCIKKKKTFSKASKQPDLLCSVVEDNASLLKVSELTKGSSALSNEEQIREKESVQTEESLVSKHPSEPLPSTEADKVVSFNDFSVESLINLFACGDLKVKKEFDDPAIDAIKTVDPKDLVSACLDSSFVAETTTMDLNSINTTHDDLPLNPNMENKGTEITQSNQESSNISDKVSKERLSISNTEECNSRNAIAAGDSASEATFHSENPLTDVKSPPVLADLIKELKYVSSMEESIKGDLQSAKEKIHEYQLLLEEWKIKKRQFQSAEEDLRKRRNILIKTMNDIVGMENCGSTEDLQNITSLSAVNNTVQSGITISQNKDAGPSENLQFPVQNAALTKDNIEDASDTSVPCVSTFCNNDNLEKHLEKDTETFSDQEEIYVIGKPDVDESKEIPVVDLESESEESASIENQAYENALLNEVQNCISALNISGHVTPINSIQVHEDYIYTCSSDFTARRFCLKDPSEYVIYHHRAKVVSQLAVQTVKKKTYVFTLCSKRCLSLFLAKDGILLKTYFQPYTVMCICKGWGLFYAGFINGYITVYKDLEEQKFVETEGQVVSMASAYQGRLHVLVIVSSNGHIGVRDAETGLLIHYLHVVESGIAHLVVQNRFAYLSTPDNVISVLDITTGTFHDKYHLARPAICFAVCKDHVLTVESDSLVHSYHQKNGTDVKYYGSGTDGLTYIHVYRSLVLTGNKKGQLAVFKFDPCVVMKCQFNGCNLVFGSKQDLVFHLEKCHSVPKKGSKCPWGSCNFAYPREWDEKERLSHIIKKDIAE